MVKFCKITFFALLSGVFLPLPDLHPPPWAKERGHVLIFINTVWVKEQLASLPEQEASQLHEAVDDFFHHTRGFRDWLKARQLPHTFLESPRAPGAGKGKPALVPAEALEKLRFGVVWIHPDGRTRICPGVCGTDIDLIFEAGVFFDCPPGNGLPLC